MRQWQEMESTEIQILMHLSETEPLAIGDIIDRIPTYSDTNLENLPMFNKFLLKLMHDGFVDSAEKIGSTRWIYCWVRTPKGTEILKCYQDNRR